MKLRDTQTKTIALLEAAATANGLELVDDKRFANTGTLRIERIDSVTPLINIGYSFQDDRAKFSVSPASDMGRRKDGELYLAPDQLMDQFINPLVEVMATFKTAAK